MEEECANRLYRVIYIAAIRMVENNEYHADYEMESC